MQENSNLVRFSNTKIKLDQVILQSSNYDFIFSECVLFSEVRIIQETLILAQYCYSIHPFPSLAQSSPLGHIPAKCACVTLSEAAFSFPARKQNKELQFPLQAGSQECRGMRSCASSTSSTQISCFISLRPQFLPLQNKQAKSFSKVPPRLCCNNSFLTARNTSQL